MAKVNFYDIPNEEKEAIFQQISTNTGMPAYAVEKDWWVVQTLSIIFEMDVAQHLVFKGGTSLSKAWKLIDRFSEDIDLAIDRAFFKYEGDISGKDIGRLRKAANEYISTKFYPELKERFSGRGFNEIKWDIEETENPEEDPVKIYINYPEIISSPGYIQPRIQIEISCRSLREPFTIQTFGSLVDEQYAEKDFAQEPIQVPTVNPERTFLEKIFLLHEEFHRPLDKIRVNRLSRHLYDIYHLSKTEFAKKALADKELYITIVEHRYKFSRVGQVNYNEHQPQTINPLPIQQVANEWKEDYNTMLEQMIYEQDPPSYSEMIEELNNLKIRINALEWKFDKEFPLPNS
jgi:predicted nucleotidyltransferase component of viral defense system